jgi:uncharacterized SAM-binding protein YcdF (DUF218 family)
MLHLAKILPTLVLPTGLVILLLLASAVFRKRALALMALAVLWISSTPLVGDAAMRAAEGWAVRQPVSSAPNADAIVVLSGMLRAVPGSDDGVEWEDAVDRFDAGVDLARAGKAPLLIFTSAWLPWDPAGADKGHPLADRAAARGVAPDRVAVTGKVSNTAEEARAVRDLLTARDESRRAPRSIILVTSAFHMRRSRLLFERAGLLVMPFPVDFRTSASPYSFMDVLPDAGGLLNTETAIREFYGYLYYRLIKTD